MPNEWFEHRWPHPSGYEIICQGYGEVKVFAEKMGHRIGWTWPVNVKFVPDSNKANGYDRVRLPDKVIRKNADLIVDKYFKQSFK